MNKKIYISSLLIILTGILSCVRERTPVEPSLQPDPHVIKGNAKLENQTDHYGVFVYLEGLKIYTLTDSLGNYTLTIPDSLFSGDTLTTQGKFHIYYSFMYYDFDSSLVKVNRQGFVFDQEDVNDQGYVTPVMLNQYLDFKSITDKKVYTPDDTLWVQLTLTNLSDRDFIILFYGQCGYAIYETTLFNDSTFWYFVGPTCFIDAWIKLNPGQSINRSARYPLASIRDSHWGISFPWDCYVKPEGYDEIAGLREMPEALEGVVLKEGMVHPRIIDYFLSLRFFREKFSLAKITIKEK